MATLTELTSMIVSAQVSKKNMTTEEILQSMHQIHEALKILETGIAEAPAPAPPEEPQKPTLTIKQAFKKDEIICMVCNKGGFKTLKKHLAIAHQLTPGQYRKQFGIKSTQKLAAKSFSETRRAAAEARGMKDVLAKARETRKANLEKKKASVPAKKVKAPVPAVRKKAAVPVAVKKTAPKK